MNLYEIYRALQNMTPEQGADYAENFAHGIWPELLHKTKAPPTAPLHQSEAEVGAALDMPSVRQITSPVAAKMIGITPSTLAHWRMAGRGPRWHHLHPGSRSVRYFEHEVVRWMLENGGRSQS